MTVRVPNYYIMSYIETTCDALSGVMAEERPITIDEACALKLLLFGDTVQIFSEAWTQQTFRFRSVPSYGFIQRRAGPCGLLASVQAYVICEILFGESSVERDGRIAKLNLPQKEEALARALTTILWQASDNRKAIVAVKRNRAVFDDSVSAILQMDDCLEYEIINLVLIGKAVPNLFDGDLELNSGGTETSRHRGIPRRSTIGLLSSYEYQETCTVGDNLKNPVFPIWLLLGESHFTVLFSLCRDVLRNTGEPEDSFTLFHYDGLARRHSETAFLIKPFANESALPKDKTYPSAVRCMFTRWPLADIEIKHGSLNG